jgi:hypothetical protein
MNHLLEDLLKKEENLWLEFKCCWKDVDESKIWGEFLKDFASLFNTYTETNDTKYLIIGFDETTKKCQNYNENNGEILSVFSNIEDFKTKISKKLKNHFKNIPSYKDLNNLPDIENYFNIDIVNYNDSNLLIFTILPAPYLLELHKQLIGNETFRDGNIVTRNLKKDNTPEIINAPSNKIKELEKYVNKNKREKFPEKNISIEKITTVFKNKYFPASNVILVKKEHNYSSGIFYEIFSIEGGEYSLTIDFIYFSKYTNQAKTLNYISDNDFLKNKNKKIVLIDEKNRDGGIIGKKRIEKLFKNKFDDSEIYYIEEFSYKKLYNELLNGDIFYSESFNINDYIQPYTDKSNDKTADMLLKEWYKSGNQPLSVLKGIGGIGKTTVVKYFLDTLYQTKQDDNLNILFINSHDLIHDIMRNPKIEDLFDFYRILAEKYQVKKMFDKNNLELSIDDGNLIIVLDGLDEVIAKIGSKFNINKFITSIFEEYSGNMGKAKIIITCRDYFWDKSIENDYKILSLDLKPFTKEMAKKYFERHFDKTNKIDKAIKLAEEFSIDDIKYTSYIPYVLDMIRENFLVDNEKNSIESQILLKEGSLTDFIVGKVCEREIVKLDNLSIDEQIELLMTIAFEYDGVVDDVHLNKLEKRENINSEKFRAHPLLNYSIKNQKLKFRYDFFNEYFKNIKLSQFIKNNDLDNISKDMIDILIQHISYDGSLMKDLLKRLEELDFEELKTNILIYIKDELKNRRDLDDNIKNRVSSSLFILLMVLGKCNNKHSKTELMKEIYEEKEIIENLCLINLHSTNSKITFDFNDLYFKNCHFENYENFSECNFNEKTFFSKCTFIAPLYKKNIHIKFSKKNFDQSEHDQCQLDGLYEILEESENDQSSQEEVLRNELKRIFRLFWQGSTFKQKLKNEIRKKMKNNNKLIDLLVEKNIFIEANVVTSQKRHDKAYKINKKYANLRKIMEENNTCSEFEEIVTIIMQNLYNKT